MCFLTTRQAGAEVILVERYGFLGGNTTAALVMPLMSFHTQRPHAEKPGTASLLPGDPVLAGVVGDFVQRLVDAGGAVAPSLQTDYVVMPVSMATGQAAGVCAALAAHDGTAHASSRRSPPSSRRMPGSISAPAKKTAFLCPHWKISMPARTAAGSLTTATAHGCALCRSTSEEANACVTQPFSYSPWRCRRRRPRTSDRTRE